jgi:hypothetical protein
MQRLKSFLVVCISILFLGEAWGQNIPPGAFSMEDSALSDHSGYYSGGVNQHSPAGNMLLPVGMPANSFGLPAFPVSGIPSSLVLVSESSVDAWGTGWGKRGGTGLYLHRAASPEKISLSSLQAQGNVQALGDDYYAHHLGFFCKKRAGIRKNDPHPAPFPAGLA